jgi:serine/threonine-protein kinase
MPTELDSRATLLRADETPVASGLGKTAWSLPPDLLMEAVRRLQASALLYALAYFLASFGPTLLVPEARAIFLADPLHWLPDMLSVGGALFFAWLIGRPRLSPKQKLYAGLCFEVLGSLGIAASEYMYVTAPILQGDLGPRGFGLSWVAAFVILFSVMVPTPPAVTVISATISVATVPLVYAIGVAQGRNLALDPGSFFFMLAFPYLVVVLMSYVGSRIVYRLGAQVREAREMGSYRLVERLGEGGMGEVWRAQHRLLARPAAIKLIRPEMLGARDSDSRELLVRRFEREAQATALMRSPHTMALYDYGIAEDGTFYYVMELLDGFDLDELVKRFGPLPPERAVYLLQQMCESLAEAHEAGLIHRDIKPANLYACRYGREVDFIKILDFGLVKREPKADSSAPVVTAEGAPSGTPAFMSPEQALGDERVDARSDLYAVGCVAYWLLTGTLVFKGTTLMETIVMHVNQEPEAMSRRARFPIPYELEELVMACLAKKPGNRPQSADELSARLAAVPLDREWTVERAREWWDRHRPAGDRVWPVLEEAVG